MNRNSEQMQCKHDNLWYCPEDRIVRCRACLLEWRHYEFGVLAMTNSLGEYPVGYVDKQDRWIGKIG